MRTGLDGTTSPRADERGPMVVKTYLMLYGFGWTQRGQIAAAAAAQAPAEIARVDVTRSPRQGPRSRFRRTHDVGSGVEARRLGGSPGVRARHHRGQGLIRAVPLGMSSLRVAALTDDVRVRLQMRRVRDLTDPRLRECYENTHRLVGDLATIGNAVSLLRRDDAVLGTHGLDPVSFWAKRVTLAQFKFSRCQQ
jgi:hypothetical protein